MAPDDYARLLAAAQDDLADGWQPFELPEVIRAAGRQFEISVSRADVAAIAADALGG